MKKNYLSLLGLAPPCRSTLPPRWNIRPVADWLKLPAAARRWAPMHGDIAVSSSGEVYVSVEDPQAGAGCAGLRAGRQVPAQRPERTDRLPRLRDPPPARTASSSTAPRLRGQEVLKLGLDGKVAMTIPASRDSRRIQGDATRGQVSSRCCSPAWTWRQTATSTSPTATRATSSIDSTGPEST